MVELVTNKVACRHARPNPQIMDFVEQMGGHFESDGMTRLSGHLLGWLLVCQPERQSSEELAAALDASGGIETLNDRSRLANSGEISTETEVYVASPSPLRSGAGKQRPVSRNKR